MAKKFDKVSPKDISEKKFNQLVAALPSSDLIDVNNELIFSEVDENYTAKKQKADLEESDKKKIISDEKKNNDGEDNNGFLVDENYASEIFVFEAGNKNFGIPVRFVTEVTNDYGPVSELNGFIRSCVGTCEYRGKLVPIFDSESAYLKEPGEMNGNLNNTIITITYGKIIFALTMSTYKGLVTLPSDISDMQKRGDIDDFLDEIVWHDGSNLYIFSPEKIAKAVYRELKGQISAHKSSASDQDRFSKTMSTNGSVDYLVGKIRESYIAIEITKVLEVIEGFEVTPLYKVAEFIRGLINLRGQVIACIDLSGDLGADQIIIDERNKFIVINESGLDFALCVDELIGIQSIDKSVFQESEKVFSERVAQFFPYFVDEVDELKLIMKPELFLNSESLINYRRNQL